MNNISLTEFSNKAAVSGHLFAKHFSNYVYQQHLSTTNQQEQAELLRDLASLLLYAQSQGHVCLNLNEPPVFQEKDAFHAIEMPPVESILTSLRKCHGCCLSSEVENKETPLILAEDGIPRLYLHRYWKYEQQLKERILALLDRKLVTADKSVPDGLFSESDKASSQYAAASNALTRPFSIIAGGPGTGKTTIAVKILAAKLLQNPHTRIALAAPTGKAAARMKEAIANSVAGLNMDPSLIEAIQVLDASTIHRLLGAKFNSPSFKHDRDNPIGYDFLIVDEASMVDLPLMAKLLDAVGEQTSLLLIGDPYQLPSVEVGSIFGDIIQAGKVAPVVTTLTTNYRAKDAPDIQHLCHCINAVGASLDATVKLLLDKQANGQIKWQKMTHHKDLSKLVRLAVSKYSGFFATSGETSAEEILRTAQSFRILTALRDGPFGMSNLNHQIEAKLPDTHRLLIVTQNDVDLGLYNGDMGYSQAVEDQHVVWFSGRHKPIAAMRVPSNEPAYAMTGHKAQGSEFDEVHVVLPTDTNCPLLTREWLYTAVSRARKSVTIWGSEAAIGKCLTTSTKRHSGMFS